MKQVLLLPFIFAVLIVPALAQNITILNQKQAVAIAEKFVAENGYIADSSRGMVLSLGNRKTNLNLIQRQAVITLIKKVGRQSVWSVQFLLTEQNYKNQKRTQYRGNKKMTVTYNFGREVRMSLDGSKIWMERRPLAIEETTFPL